MERTLDLQLYSAPNDNNYEFHIEGCAPSIEMGIMPKKGFSDKIYECATIGMYYTNEILNLLRPVFAEMYRLKKSPNVHIWDANTANPKLAVVFIIPNPSREFLLRLCAKAKTMHLRDIVLSKFCRELRMSAYAAVPPKTVTAFISHYADSRRELDVRIRDIKQIRPATVFELKEFSRVAPA